jgi:[ribosomal protein S18]-alanine N-acetyltransferase
MIYKDIPAIHWKFFTPRMTQRFTIREFQRDDLPRLWEIDQKCFPPGISYSQPELLFYMRRPRAFTLVAEPAARNGRAAATPAGFIVAETGKPAGHIITIDVLKEFRRSGLGSQLMAAAEERMRAAGCTAVILETAVDNATALAFYRRHQYFLVKTLPRYYATGVDAFVLKKDLLSNE